jgi:hypothetical protein
MSPLTIPPDRGGTSTGFLIIGSARSQGFSAKQCCRILGVAASGFFMWRRRSPSPRQIRCAWLTDLVRVIHADSRGTYGWRRVNAELIYGAFLRLSDAKCLLGSMTSQ